MTGHLGLDDLAYLVGSDVPTSEADHLANCDICRERLANLRARSAEVSAALTGGSDDDVEPMPADVTARITAALAAAGQARPAGVVAGLTPVTAAATLPSAAALTSAAADAVPTRPIDISIARERRSRRVRGWLVAAAAVIVVGGGFGAIAHFASGGAASSTSGASNAAAGAPQAAVGGDESRAGAKANPAASRGVLLVPSFAADARAYLSAQRVRVPTSAAAPVPQAMTSGAPVATARGSSRCENLAGSQAASIAGSDAGGGNPVTASADLVGAVTVEGRSGVLYVVDVGPVKVAVVVAGCSTSSPDVLAGATL